MSCRTGQSTLKAGSEVSGQLLQPTAPVLVYGPLEFHLLISPILSYLPRYGVTTHTPTTGRAAYLLRYYLGMHAPTKGI